MVTAQASDVVAYAGEIFVLAGVTGDGLFDPSRYDLQLRATTTANWRGYVSHYKITDAHLVLDSLTDVGLADVFDEESMRTLAPAIEGRLPTWRSGIVYENMNLPVAFSGRLLIAREFLRDLYVHMGFHPAWKFEHVVELVLLEGELFEARDLSAEVAETRREILQGSREDPDGPHGGPGWIARTFQRGYRRGLGK